MAALLVALRVMAVLMGMAMPVWSHDGQTREGRGVDLARKAVCAGRRPFSAEVRQRLSADRSTFWLSKNFSGRNTRIRSLTTTFSSFPAGTNPGIQGQGQPGQNSVPQGRGGPGQARPTRGGQTGLTAKSRCQPSASRADRPGGRQPGTQSRHRRRRVQEQGLVDQDLQRPPEVQRVDVCLSANRAGLVRSRRSADEYARLAGNPFGAPGCAISRRPRWSRSVRAVAVPHAPWTAAGDSAQPGQAAFGQPGQSPFRANPVQPPFGSTGSIAVRTATAAARTPALCHRLWKSWADTHAAASDRVVRRPARSVLVGC